MWQLINKNQVKRFWNYEKVEYEKGNFVQLMTEEEIKEYKRQCAGAVRTIGLKLRFKILERDGFKCLACGRGVKDGVKLQVDHIHPQSKGGLNAPGNLGTLCNECNNGKSNRILTVNYVTC